MSERAFLIIVLGIAGLAIVVFIFGIGVDVVRLERRVKALEQQASEAAK